MFYLCGVRDLVWVESRSLIVDADLKTSGEFDNFRSTNFAYQLVA